MSIGLLFDVHFNTRKEIATRIFLNRLVNFFLLHHPAFASIYLGSGFSPPRFLLIRALDLERGVCKSILKKGEGFSMVMYPGLP
jgi:hypothetical protein